MSSENKEITPPQDTPASPAAVSPKGRSRQRRVGVVTSTKMQKTIAVEVKRSVAHPLYLRIVRRSSKFLAHDEKNEARVGDTVEIVETRPLSKRKRWRLKRIVTRAVQ